MFGSKRKKQDTVPDSQTASQPRMSGGYQVTEVPTYHGGIRKIVVYTSDATGKIIKTFKK